MFSWITGPRITNVSEEVHTDPLFEQTLIEAPDTPAPQFAIKAFKQALFGTPAPEHRTQGKKLEKRAELDTANSRNTDLPAPKENAATASPSKQPGGILMTPGTSRKGKSVSFGAQVVDNEGKKGGVVRSGIPNDCPGKFPSPWTPGTELKVDAASDSKPRTKLTEALYAARTTPQLKPAIGEKPKARDDTDITLDLSAPRSESGKYWKEQYESYAERSQKEVKKLVTKQQLAKNYAKKKDADAIEAITRLAEERKRFRNRERELEQQNKDYQERLRQAMAEKTAASVEITALKNRIAALEKSAVAPSSDIHHLEVQNSKLSFQIYEDANKDSSLFDIDPDRPTEARSTNAIEPLSVILGKPVKPSGFNPEDKENSPPKKLRHVRRQTLPDTSMRLTVDRTTTSENEAASDTFAGVEKSTLAPPIADQPPKSPLSLRKPQQSRENLPPKSPVAHAPSSPPLPVGSPDPWMDFGNSPVPAMDRLALPISSGSGYSRPSKPVANRHRVAKSTSSATLSTSRKTDRQPTGPKPEDEKTKDAKAADGLAERFAALNDKKTDTAEKPNAHVPEGVSHVAKSTVQHAEGNSHISKSRIGGSNVPLDRREEAKRRLMERKARKQRAAAS